MLLPSTIDYMFPLRVAAAYPSHAFSIVGFFLWLYFLFFFQAEDGIRDWSVTAVQTCALPISLGDERRGGGGGGGDEDGGEESERAGGGDAKHGSTPGAEGLWARSISRSGKRRKLRPWPT